MSTSRPPLAVLAGGGKLPTQIAEAALAQGQPVLMVTFSGQAQPEIPAGVKHVQQALGAVGQTLKLLKQYDIKQVVLAGHIAKPKLFNLRPDAKGLTLLARLARHHDDALLRGVCNMLAEEGFQVVSVPEICPELLAEEGVWGKVKPLASHRQDIAQGQEVLHTLGPLDIGQAVVVKDRVVLGVEAVEGTEALLKRCALLRGENAQGGVLVKLAKSGQTLQADMPTIGPATIATLAEHGYAGVAVEAGKTLVLDSTKTIEEANAHGLFVVGISA